MFISPTDARRRIQSGLSLIETLICSSVVSLVAGVAAPGFTGITERARLSGAAAQLRTDVQLARSLAVAENRNVRIRYQVVANGSCYVIHTGSLGACSCDVAGLAVCTGTARAVRSEAFSQVNFAMQSNVGGMTLDALKGTVSPTGTVKFTGKSGTSVHVVVNLMGRTRLCTPTAGWTSQPAC